MPARAGPGQVHGREVSSPAYRQTQAKVIALPSFIRPARVDVHMGGGLLGPAIGVGAVVVVAGLVVLFVLAHLWLIAGAAAGLAGVGSGMIWIASRFIIPRQVAERRAVVYHPILALRILRIPADLDPPRAPARAVAGLRDHLAISPAAVVHADEPGLRWPHRPPGLDSVTRQRADKIWPGHEEDPAR